MRKRTLLQLLLAAVVFSTGWYVVQPKTVAVYAQSQRQFAVLKSWGTVKGTMGDMLIFEDSSGTLRFVDTSKNGNVYLVINRN
jgi:hypothetical protein